MTKTRAIVNSMIPISYRYGIFNDRLSDGTRSVKVYGWNEKDYDECAKLLTEAGCIVTKKAYRNSNFMLNDVQIRLWVQE